MLGGVLAAVAGLVTAVTVFACTTLPSIDLSQPYAGPGGSLELTGTAWRAGMGAVSVHWDSVSGPLLAQASVNPDGTLQPVTFAVPSTAHSGYHVIETTLPGNPGVVARAVLQVTGGSSVSAPMPVAQLPGATTSNPSPAGAGGLALLAAIGAAGLVLLGMGTAFWIRSARRIPTTARTVRRR